MLACVPGMVSETFTRGFSCMLSKNPEALDQKVGLESRTLTIKARNSEDRGEGTEGFFL